MTQFEPPTAPVVTLSGTKPKKPFDKRVWFLVLAGLLAIGIFAQKSSDSKSTKPISTTQVTAIPTTEMPTTTVPEPLWTEILKPMSSSADVSNSICSGLDSVIKKQAKIIKVRLSATSKPSQDAFDSADYLNTIDWATFDHFNNIVTEQRAVSDPQLAGATLSIPTEKQFNLFLNDTLVTCALDNASFAVLADASSLDSRLGTMRLHANNLPWYPKGFSEYDSGIAFKFLKYGSEYRCSYYGAYCWGIEFISKSSCSSFYVELSILDSSGANIGYTNDLTSNVNPLQRVKMVFNSYEDGAKSGQIAQVTCS